MKHISNKEAVRLSKSGEAIILDVREPVEFQEGHLINAINIPSTDFKIEDLNEWSDRMVCLVCQSGSRAGEMMEKIEQAYPNMEIYLLENQMESFEQQINLNKWSVDRQFRFTLGLLLAVSLIGVNFSMAFLAIPVILCLGLITTSIIDKCYLRLAITKMPWNRVIINVE
jgi:rhodanese-related sulfurtransferase